MLACSLAHGDRSNPAVYLCDGPTDRIRTYHSPSFSSGQTPLATILSRNRLTPLLSMDSSQHGFRPRSHRRCWHRWSHHRPGIKEGTSLSSIASPLMSDPQKERHPLHNLRTRPQPRRPRSRLGHHPSLGARIPAPDRARRDSFTHSSGAG